MKPTIASRRARIARVNAKRPQHVAVDPVYKPNPVSRERLIDLLVELLDAARGSGRG